MRKVLLTSSQVSVILSAIIIVSCTVALFLSGYAIQQRTLRELRTAVRPRPRAQPKTYLPAKFRPKESQSADHESSRRPRGRTTEIEVTLDHGSQGSAAQSSLGSDAGVSQWKLDTIAALQADVAAKSWAVENPDPKSKNAVPMSRAERRKVIKDELTRLGRGDSPVLWQRKTHR